MKFHPAERNNYTMKSILKKLTAFLVSIVVIFGTMPVAFAGINISVEDAYYECAEIYPEFVQKVLDSGATEAQIINLLADVQKYLLGLDVEITEDNFEDYMIEAILQAVSKRAHITVRNALVKAFPDAVLDGADGIIAPEFEPMVETVKAILFREVEEPTDEATEPSTEETQPTEEKEPPTDKEEETQPADKETEPPTEKETEKPTKPSGGGPGGGGPSGTGSDKFNDEPDDEVEQPTENATRPIDKTFTDISQAQWAEKAVYALVDMGVINGYPDRTFKPNNPITRAEFAKIIVTASGRYVEKDKATYVSKFTDVLTTDWHYPYVSAALKFGFITGRSETIFDPNSNITRADLCLIVYRYIKSLNPEFKAKADTPVTFVDSSLVPSWTQEAVTALWSNGIATVRDTVNNKFEPTLPATRAECAQIVYNALNAALGLKK